MHIGSATVGARLRPLDGAVLRLRLASPLPLRIGDRLLLRDPGTRRVLGADVRDVDPPELRRRGAARQRAAELAARPTRRPAPRPTSPAAGSSAPTTSRRWAGRCRTAPTVHGPWLLAAGPGRRAGRAAATGRGRATGRRIRWSPGRRPRSCVGCSSSGRRAADRRRPAAPGSCARGGSSTARPTCPPTVQRAVDGIRTRLAADPFAAPEAGDLAAAGLGVRELAAAVRSGQLVRIAEGVYLAPGIAEQARARLADRPAAVHAQPGAAGVGDQPPGRRPAHGVARPPGRHRPAARQHPPPPVAGACRLRRPRGACRPGERRPCGHGAWRASAPAALERWSPGRVTERERLRGAPSASPPSTGAAAGRERRDQARRVIPWGSSDPWGDDTVRSRRVTERAIQGRVVRGSSRKRKNRSRNVIRRNGSGSRGAPSVAARSAASRSRPWAPCSPAPASASPTPT